MKKRCKAQFFIIRFNKQNYFSQIVSKTLSYKHFMFFAIDSLKAGSGLPAILWATLIMSLLYCTVPEYSSPLCKAVRVTKLALTYFLNLSDLHVPWSALLGVFAFCYIETFKDNLRSSVCDFLLWIKLMLHNVYHTYFWIIFCQLYFSYLVWSQILPVASFIFTV